MRFGFSYRYKPRLNDSSAMLRWLKFDFSTLKSNYDHTDVLFTLPDMFAYTDDVGFPPIELYDSINSYLVGKNSKTLTVYLVFYFHSNQKFD